MDMAICARNATLAIGFVCSVKGEFYHRLFFARPQSHEVYFRGFARKVGSAWVGSSGQGCLGYWARMSLRTSS